MRRQDVKIKSHINFLFGNVVDEVVNEINNNNYDLVVMLNSHIDSWFILLFNDMSER